MAIWLALALGLSGCATKPVTAPSAQATATQPPQSRTYCDAMKITGSLLEDLSQPDHDDITCLNMSNERGDKATQAHIDTWTGASGKTGTLDLLLLVTVYDQYVPMAQMQPAAPIGLDTHKVTRIFIGRESQLSAGDTHVQMLAKQTDGGRVSRLCVLAFRTPAYKRPLDITFCRTYDAHLNDADSWAALQRMVVNDLPQIALR